MDVKDVPRFLPASPGQRALDGTQHEILVTQRWQVVTLRHYGRLTSREAGSDLPADLDQRGIVGVTDKQRCRHRDLAQPDLIRQNLDRRPSCVLVAYTPLWHPTSPRSGGIMLSQQVRERTERLQEALRGERLRVCTRKEPCRYHLVTGHVLDPVQFGVPVRVGGFLPGPGPLEGDAALMQDLPQPLPPDGHRPARTAG